MTLRAATQNTVTLDDFLRGLWKQYATTGIPEGGIIDLLTQWLDASQVARCRAMVETTDALPLEQSLAYVGLKMTRNKTDIKNTLVLDMDAYAYLGAEITDKNIVSYIAPNSPAYMAGLSTGDTIVALDNVQIRSSHWKDCLRTMPLNKPVSLHYFRYATLYETQVSLQSLPKTMVTISVIETDKAAEVCRNHWLKTNVISN